MEMVGEKLPVGHLRARPLTNWTLITRFPGKTLPGRYHSPAEVHFTCTFHMQAIFLSTLLILLSKMSKCHGVFASFTQDSKLPLGGVREMWLDSWDSTLPKGKRGVTYHLTFQSRWLCWLRPLLRFQPNQKSSQNKKKCSVNLLNQMWKIHEVNNKRKKNTSNSSNHSRAPMLPFGSLQGVVWIYFLSS